MSLSESFYSKLAGEISKSILSLNNFAFLVKEVNGPFLYANEIFYQIMKDFIKTKNITGKMADEVFLKSCLAQMDNEEDIFLENNYISSSNNLVLKKNDKVSFFTCNKFKIKNLNTKLKTKKKIIGVILLKSTQQTTRDIYIEDGIFQIHSTKLSNLIKTIKDIAHIDKNNQNKSKKLKKVVKQIEDLSNRDYLTTLYNRHAFEDLMKLEVKRALRYHYPISLLVIDIDDFKSVNSNYGHICGDEVLKKLSRVLMHSVRETDYTCRWGGEEFAIILPKCNLKNAEQTANKILKNVIKKIVTPVKITVSIGVAQLKPDENITSWFIHADEALFQAKKNGKKQVFVSQE